MAISGLVIDRGLVRLSVLPCNLGNLGIDRRQNNRLHGENISKRVLDSLAVVQSVHESCKLRS